MSKVEYKKLKEFCSVNQGLQIPIAKRFTENGKNRFFYITIQFLKDSHSNKFYIENPPKSSICNKEDILIVRTGSTGKVITGVKGSFHNNFFKVNYNKEKINGRYLYHCLNTKEKQKEMATRAGITTIPDLNHFMFLDMKIPFIKDLKKQIGISNVLDSIDSKIELHNRINAELEKMAKTLYDYWFVQFDFPDQNGKPYKSSGGKMVFDEKLKREIPEGWEVKKLGDICDIYQPKTISAKDCIENGRYFVHGSNGVIGKYNEYNHEKSEIIVSCRGDCGNIHRTIPKMWITGNAMVFKLKDQTINNEYLYQLLFWSGIKNISSGSVQGQITRTNVSPLKVVKPQKDLLNKFSKITNSIVEKKLLIIAENQKLAELRDWLLPMLMNGQVEVV